MSFKDQLRDEILPKTVEYYNNGDDINSAIVKAASDFKLNIDQTDRLVETMNTARVIAHYEKNAEDRTSNCDIADKDVVHRMLFESRAEKKASANASIEYDYSSYTSTEKDYRHLPKMTKAAETQQTVPQDATEGLSRRQIVDTVVKYASDLETQRKFVEEHKGMAEACLATKITKLASMLSSGYEPEDRYAIFKFACAKMPKAVKAVDEAVSPELVKNATAHYKTIRRQNVLDTTAVNAELGLAKELEADLNKIAEFDTILSSIAKKEAETKGLLNRYQRIEKQAFKPFGSTEKPKDKKEDDSKNKKNKGSGNKDPWTSRFSKDVIKPFKATRGAIYDAISVDVPGEKGIHDYFNSGLITGDDINDALFGKSYETEGLTDYVNNIRREAILSELYNDDPILSEADPNALANAYNTLISTAPETSLNKEVVRAILRQSVNATAISPFDVRQWVDLDSALLHNRQAT